MSIFTNQSGTWTQVDKLHVKHEGSWVEVQKGWVKENGVWEQTFGGSVEPPAGRMTEAWTTNSAGGVIWVFNISDPSNIGTLDKTTGSEFPKGWGFGKIVIDVDANLGFCSSTGGAPNYIYALNTSDPTDSNTWLMSSLEVDLDEPGSKSINYDKARGKFYTKGNVSELHVFDVSDPMNMSFIATIPFNCNAYAIDIVNEHLYSVGNPNELVTYDISDPTSPVVLGTYTYGDDIDYSNAVGAFDYARNLLFIFSTNNAIEGNDELHIFDISDPSAIVLLSEMHSEDYVYKVEYDPTLQVLIASQGDNGYGLTCYDVSNPASPSMVGTEDGNQVYSVALDAPFEMAFIVKSGGMKVYKYPEMVHAGQEDFSPAPTDIALAKSGR